MRWHLVLFWFVLAAASSVKAQTVAKMEFLNGYWMLDVEAGNKLIHESLQARYGEANVKSMDIVKLKNQFASYVAENVLIYRDSVLMPMSPFHIELNSAKGLVRLISPRFESHGDELLVKFGCFDDPGRSVRLVVIPENSRCIATLNEVNEFQADIILQECERQ
ncbi:MAG: hypothetical protein R2813_13030 [Flavobacteriales bacterium]